MKSVLRFRLCLVLTRAACRLAPMQVLEESIRGGVDLVQLREKSLCAREFGAWATDALAACRASSTPMVVNDSVEIAGDSGADGVHLGQQDLAPEQARKLLGPSALIGWSTRTMAQLEQAAAMQDVVNYVGFGPAFPTATKGYVKGLGPERIRVAVTRAGEFGLPILMIGGITIENRPLLGALGPTTGLAVSAALCTSPDPCEAASALLRHAESRSNRTLGEC